MQWKVIKLLINPYSINDTRFVLRVSLRMCVHTWEKSNEKITHICCLQAQNGRYASCMCVSCSDMFTEGPHVRGGPLPNLLNIQLQVCQQGHSHIVRWSIGSHRNVPGNVLYFAVSASPTHIVSVCQYKIFGQTFAEVGCAVTALRLTASRCVLWP